MRSLLSLVAFVVFIIMPFVAWVTHVVYCITHALWVVLVVGALVFPVGIIHGIMVWFGAGM